jgi:hypothetical protein
MCKRRHIEATLKYCLLRLLHLSGKFSKGCPLFCLVQHRVLEAAIKVSAGRIKVRVGLDLSREHGKLSLSK